jgi:hypothetical protein
MLLSHGSIVFKASPRASERFFKRGVAVAVTSSRMVSPRRRWCRLVVVFVEADAAGRERSGKERRRVLTRENSGAMRARGKQKLLRAYTSRRRLPNPHRVL